MDILTNHHISLYTIPVYWLLSLSLKIYATAVYTSLTKEAHDNRSPRTFTEKVTSSTKLDAATKARLIRAEGASANGFENFGPFVGAVVAANAAKLDPSFVNGVTAAFLASRVVYNYLYIVNVTGAQAQARSLTYTGGMILLFSLFVSAGNQFW